jgi:hypothetical protein
MKRRAKKSGAKSVAPKKKAAARAKKPASRKSAAPSATTVSRYTPAPLTSDGWPPFRYPLQ